MKTKATFGQTCSAIFKSLLVIVGIILFSAIIQPICMYFMPNYPVVIQAYTSMILVYLITILLVFYVHNDGPFLQQLKEKLHFRRFKPIDILKIIMFAVILVIIASIVSGILALIFKSGSGNSNDNVTTQAMVNGMHGIWRLFGMIIIPVLIAPFFEEAIFRQGIGYIFNVFNHGSKIGFIITESVIFGILHLQLTGSPLAIASSMIAPMVSGVILGLIYLRYQTFWYSYMTHASYNMIVVIVTLLSIH